LANGTDLLSILLRESKDENISDELLQAEIMTFLAAGHETTSVALSWALYCLSLHLESQVKLRAELLQAFPDPNYIPTYDELHSLSYLNCVVKETLRLYPPAAMTSRYTTKDEVLPGDIFVKKDTTFLISPYVIHHLEEFWGKDVHEFKPERWLDPELESQELFAFIYLPFLAGPRSCIGNKLASMEMKMLLFMLIKTFKFAPVPGLEVQRRMTVTLRPFPQLKLRVSLVV